MPAPKNGKKDFIFFYGGDFFKTLSGALLFA
jgi:hypothetical protein